MSPNPDRQPTQSGPVPVRLMVDFSTGKIVGAIRPVPMPVPRDEPPRIGFDPDAPPAAA